MGMIRFQGKEEDFNGYERLSKGERRILMDIKGFQRIEEDFNWYKVFKGERRISVGMTGF